MYNFVFNILILNICIIIILLCINRRSSLIIKKFSLISSFILLGYILLAYIFFNVLGNSYQFNYSIFWSNIFNINYTIGIDGVSLSFFLLTSFLIPLCILNSWNNIKYRLKEFMITLFVIEFLLLNIFCVLDLFFFYIFFESILIPMLFLIGIWGSRQRKTHAVYLFFFYTFVGSIFMLIALLIIYSECQTFDLRILLTMPLSHNKELLLWPAFFFAFAVKVPMFPFHIWLPEAHVEAPTVGSVILAGILLKLGGYGLFRFVLPLFPYASYYYTPIVYLLSVIAIIYASCTTIRQVDLKKIIAYASVAHMNYVTLGLFSTSLQAITGSIFLMWSHGLVSSALFFCVGFLYDRYKTRLIKYYQGLVNVMPIFSVVFMLLTLANISFPGTSNFIGEFLVLVGLIENNVFAVFCGLLGVILGAVYAMWLYNRIIFGTLNDLFKHHFADLSFKEFVVVLPLIVLIFILGLFPNALIDLYIFNVYTLLEYR